MVHFVDIGGIPFNCSFQKYQNLYLIWGHCGLDRMVVGLKTTYAISAYHHKSCEFKSHSWQGVLETTLCDKVGQ